MHLPHVSPFANHPIYFFTACVDGRRSLLACREAKHVLEEIWRTAAELDGWFVGRYILMPDHVHFFARPSTEAVPRQVWCKNWKSISSRRLAAMIGARPPIWQPDTFDHILRAAESFSAKWDYVCANPVRAGFVTAAEDWAWQGEIYPLTF